MRCSANNNMLGSRSLVLFYPLCTKNTICMGPFRLLPPLNEQEVDSHVSQHQKGGAKDSEPDDVCPQGEHVEAKTGQNCGTRNLDIQAVFVVDEREVAHLVDNEAFEAVVEDGEL